MGVDDYFTGWIKRRVHGSGNAGANRVGDKAIHPGQHHPPIGQDGRRPSLIGDAQIKRRQPGMAVISADPAMNIQIGGGRGVISPGKGGNTTIGRNTATQIPVKDAPRCIFSGDHWFAPGQPLIGRMKEDHLLIPLTAIQVVLVGFNTHRQCTVGQLENGIGQAGGANRRR